MMILKGIWLGYGVVFRCYGFHTSANQTAEEMIPCHAIWVLCGTMLLCEKPDIEVLAGPSKIYLPFTGPFSKILVLSHLQK